jgi:DNA-binding GntR family transcriptional regulator
MNIDIKALSDFTKQSEEEVRHFFKDQPEFLHIALMGLNLQLVLKEQIEKHQILKELILFIHENFSVGGSLDGEREVAERLGYERSTIREYYPRLQLCGYLDIQHGKSTIFKRQFEPQIIESTR